MLTILPLESGAAPAGAASLFAMRGSGSCTSTIAFRLSLHASLPVAHSLRLVPRALVARGAEKILQRRVREILDGLARRSIDAFRDGQAPPNGAAPRIEDPPGAGL